MIHEKSCTYLIAGYLNGAKQRNINYSKELPPKKTISSTALTLQPTKNPLIEQIKNRSSEKHMQINLFPVLLGSPWQLHCQFLFPPSPQFLQLYLLL